MIKIKIRAAALLCTAFLLAGCGRQTSASVPDVTTTSTTAAQTTAVTQTETTAETTTTTQPLPERSYDPLTGLRTLDPQAEGKRPIAVMINNLRAALPQYGIEAADVIYELPVEGGITRLMAVYADYQSMPNVCSVRSCRYYYPILCLGMDAFYCHWGSDQTIALETLKRTGIDHFDGGYLYGSVFFRDSARLSTYSSEHTGYLDGGKIGAYIESHGYRTDRDEMHQDPMFRFVSEEAQFTPADLTAQNITLQFSKAYYSTFTYDAETGVYLKQHSGKLHIDQNTGNQLAFKNVFVLKTEIHTREDGYLMDVALTGGTGYYAANGGMQPITWQKESEASPIRVYDADGAELNVNPGKSYIGIIGNNAAVTYH